MFRIDRVLELNSTAKSFRPRRVALLREYLALLHKGDVKEATPS
jgi:hypothetical protein